MAEREAPVGPGGKLGARSNSNLVAVPDGSPTRRFLFPIRRPWVFDAKFDLFSNLPGSKPAPGCRSFGFSHGQHTVWPVQDTGKRTWWTVFGAGPATPAESGPKRAMLAKFPSRKWPAGGPGGKRGVSWSQYPP